MTEFDASVISAVTGHMNGDHVEDNLLIARAFGYPEASGSTMVGLDGTAGVWSVTDPAGTHELRVDWPAGVISERPQIRREVVLLYRAACEKLGIAPREEHQEPQHLQSAQDHAHGGHGHGHGAHGAAGGHGHPHGASGHPYGAANPHAAAEDHSFSGQLRRATWGDHGDSEHATFMEDIMRGRATREDYAALVAQHYFVYLALEEVAEQLVQDPAYAAFHPAALVRLPALEVDLEHLLGSGWRELVSPVPATEAYAARIREVGAEGWKPGIVAHHYTRYLGDLSGGQAISRLMVRQHGFEGAGVAFYDFPELGDLREFKEGYRDALDALGAGLDDAERQRMIDEVRAAYRFNTETFLDLGKAREATAA